MFPGTIDFIKIFMVVKIYIDYSSQPSQAVATLCLLANIPHEVVEVQLFKEQHLTPQYESINPMKQVPALYDPENDLRLSQSHAIMRYLCAKFKVDEQWYPQEDLAKQARINQYLDYHHLRTRKCAQLVFNLFYGPIIKVTDPSFDEQKTRKIVAEALTFLEKHYLKDRFIGGDKPCIGDLAGFFEVTMLDLLDFDFNPYPILQKWFVEMRKIEAVNKVNEWLNANAPELKKLKQQNHQ